jgi:hypothetical protein
MKGTHPRAGAAVLGVAGSGVALGHWLTYAINIPDPHTRATVLAETGHAYLPLATSAAAVAGLAALAFVFMRRLMRRDNAGSVQSQFSWMAAFQVGAFISMEVMERVAAGASLTHLLHGPILPFGVVIQLTIALVGVLLLRYVLRAADAIVRSIAGSGVLPSARSWVIDHGGQVGLRSVSLASGSIRGPPAPHLA